MNFYLQNSFSELNRLLGLMDKNPLSPTYGCFDKTYWHHRLTDFPSGSRQQAVLCLAYFYLWEDSKNPYYFSKDILEYIQAALVFSQKIQKSDGCFDEWYPNERGWAGPTGYVIYALAKTYELLQDHFSEEFKKPIRKSLLKGASFLAYGWEAHVLSNHIAMALLPISIVSKQFESTLLKKQYDILFGRFLENFNQDEGWGVEYDGPDIGYQSATVSFLSRLYSYDPNPLIKGICEKSLEFLSFWCFPDGTFARKFGSRQCEVLFHYGIEFWSEKGMGVACSISRWDKQSLKEHKQLLPRDHEDHYFIYRMVEFVETGFLASQMNGGQEEFSVQNLPFQNDNFQKIWKKGKLFVQKKEDHYLCINMGRGGAVLLFNCALKSLEKADFGTMLKTRNGKLLTTLDFNTDCDWSFNKEYLFIEGYFKEWESLVFSPLKMIFFRKIMLLLGWNSKISYHLKSIIRILLLKRNERSSLLFQRKIDLNKTFGASEDKIINNEGIGIEEKWSGGLFEIRYVPQSRYFTSADLGHGPKNRRD